MAYTLVRHQIQDFEKWKSVFEQTHLRLKECGCENFKLFRNTDRPHEIILYMQWKTLEDARFYINSEFLEDALSEAGITDSPDFFYLEEVNHQWKLTPNQLATKSA